MGERTPDGEPVALKFHGGPAASAVPLGVFVVWAVVQSGLFGIGDTSGLVAGMLLGLILGMLFVKGSWTRYANLLFEGMTQRVVATSVVAWLWAGMFAQTVQAGRFVEGLIWAAGALEVGAGLFPAVAFLLTALLATGIGTGYGTAIAFTALLFPAGVAIGASPVLTFGAILSGSVFGDNLAPVSDTTIISAVTQQSDIGGVVSSRLKYAVVAALLALVGYWFGGTRMAGAPIPTAEATIAGSAWGLTHLLSIGVVILTAIRGRHIAESISWGLALSVALNLCLGALGWLAVAPADMLLFAAPESSSIAVSASTTPVLGAVVRTVPAGEAGVGGSIPVGARGFFSLIVLTLLIVAGAEILKRGGGFRAMQTFLLERVATSVRRAETTMVLGTALLNAGVTINTAAEIAIAPFVKRVGERFNINGYRRANILDANSSAMGYIFPWGGGILAGYSAMVQLPTQYAWFTRQMLVSPGAVCPFVFHGWLLVGVFLAAALTGYGREYIADRTSQEVARA